MLRLRTHAGICAAFFVSLLLVGWGGAALAGAGMAPPPAWRWPLLALVFALLLGFAFSAVPVMVLLVTGAQRRIGTPGAAVATPRWQNAIVYVLWGLMAAGTAIAVPAAIALGAFEDFKFDPGTSQGTLVARPGMTIAEVKRASTLPIDAKDDSPAIGEGGVFDFQVAGTAIRFPRCRYYFASSYTKQPGLIEGISLGTSTSKSTRAQLEAADAALREKLRADGWQAGHELFRTQEDRDLHGGAQAGPEGDLWLKDGTVLEINRKRMDERVDGEPADAGEWIQVVELGERAGYPYIDRFEFAQPATR